MIPRILTMIPVRENSEVVIIYPGLCRLWDIQFSEATLLIPKNWCASHLGSEVYKPYIYIYIYIYDTYFIPDRSGDITGDIPYTTGLDKIYPRSSLVHWFRPLHCTPARSSCTPQTGRRGCQKTRCYKWFQQIEGRNRRNIWIAGLLPVNLTPDISMSFEPDQIRCEIWNDMPEKSTLW